MSQDESGQPKLDTPRKCLDWAKKELGWDERAARENLGLPSKEQAKKKFVPGGPFVSTGDAELDQLLFGTIEVDTKATAPVDAELELEVAGEAWWHWREKTRFDRKHNKNVRIEPVFVKKFLTDQGGKKFVYCSRKEPEKIIYTPDIASGRSDRRVLTTVGRFLTKHYPALGEAKIKAIAEEHNATYKNPAVYFALGADEIELAYEKGPTSCMMGKSKWAALRELPTRLYDGPDCAVAYLKNASGSISARCLIDIHETPMAYSRIYGDAALLQARLGRLGFQSKEGMSGARMRKAIDPTARLYICPYVDWAKHVEIGEKYYTINGSGKGKKVACNSSTGYLATDKIPLSEIPAELLEQAKNVYTCYLCSATIKGVTGRELDHEGHEICPSCIKTYFVSAIYDRSNARKWMTLSHAAHVGEEWYNPRNAPLMEREGIVRSEWANAWLRRSEAVPRREHCDWIPKANAVQLVCGGYALPEDTSMDPENRYVYSGDRRYIYDEDGFTRLYFHPDFLPKCIVQRGSRFVLATKEHA